jgi:CheY-like chemotaxis protein
MEVRPDKQDRLARVILIVDDDVSLIELTRLIVERLGCRSSVARDGVEALELMRAAIPDFVITDITMPRMNGLELLQRIRANPKTEGVPVVLLTAMQVQAPTNVPVLVKPFTTWQLQQVLGLDVNDEDADQDSWPAGGAS